MKKSELYAEVLKKLREQMPPIDTELDYGSPFQLLVAVVLSAQCTDNRVNIVTKALFQKYPTAQEMAKASEAEIFAYISSVSYPNSKAGYLKHLSEMLVRDYGGEVPATMEDLTRLPGVGRKTANVILALVFKEAALAVDTHVFRVSHRLGLVPERCTTPLAVEMELKKHIDQAIVAQSHFWLLYHGRYTCLARRPKCQICRLTHICKYYKQTNK
ncbi:MAG: endonuclease III [Bacteroidaceae bacterium]|nr:endonuclease III [Bacteroidaceae bacterium]MBR3634116.1 endonuclease III [Bacteroidaceae bacterium]